MRIETTFGAIRPWLESDAGALALYADNRKVWLNLRDAFPHPYTIADAEAFIRRTGSMDPVTMFAVATPQEAIGGIGISIGGDVHGLSAEMGYWLAEPFWGMGIMTETVKEFSDFCFQSFGLLRIYAEPYAGNAGSCRVLEKAGFTLEGRLRSNVVKDGLILDQFMYARIREDRQGLRDG